MTEATQLKCSLGRWNQNQNEFHVYLNRRFQPYQLKKVSLRSGISVPTSAEGASPLEVPGTCSLVQNFKICAFKMSFPAF